MGKKFWITEPQLGIIKAQVKASGQPYGLINDVIKQPKKVVELDRIKANKIWVKKLQQARLFKRKADLFSFFRCSYENKGDEGLFIISKSFIFEYSIFPLVIELVITGVQKQITKEYHNKQLLMEIEK